MALDRTDSRYYGPSVRITECNLIAFALLWIASRSRTLAQPAGAESYEIERRTKMTIGIELRLASPVAAMEAFIEPHRPWLESVLGCPLSESVTFELEVAFGQLVAEDLLGGVPLDRECLAGAETLRPVVSRWAIPPGLSPRMTLQPGRNRQAPIIARDLAWDPHWKETPVALWFHGFQHAVAAINTPSVSFTAGGIDDWQPLLIVNRSELAPALKLLSGVLVESRKTVRVLGGHNVALPPNGYDWDRVVLDPTLIRLVRDDFESFLKREGWFKQHRLPFRRGYLFYGPPGNGKTSVLRVMASHPAISAHSLDFSNEELENGALTTVFEEAGRRAPPWSFLRTSTACMARQRRETTERRSLSNIS